MTSSAQGRGDEEVLLTALRLSANLLDFLREREIELTRRRELEIRRDVEVAKIRNFAQIVIAAINGARETRAVLIGALSEGIRDAIAAGNTEVALELSRLLGGLGSLSDSISRGLAATSGRRSIEQA